MKITKRQLKRIIREAWDAGPDDETLEINPADGVALQKAGYRVGALVRSVDYRGDGWGGDFERVLGNFPGTIIEIDDSEDGPVQFIVNWPAGEPTMADSSELELVEGNKIKITKRQLRRIIREVGRSEHDAEASGMVKSYNAGYRDAFRSPGRKRVGPNREYKRGYEKGLEDAKRGVRPPDDDNPGRGRMRRGRMREAGMHLTGRGWKDPAPGEADSLWPKPGYGKDPTPQERRQYGYDDAMAGIPRQESYDASYDLGYEEGLMDAQAQGLI